MLLPHSVLTAMPRRTPLWPPPLFFFLQDEDMELKQVTGLVHGSRSLAGVNPSSSLAAQHGCCCVHTGLNSVSPEFKSTTSLRR